MRPRLVVGSVLRGMLAGAELSLPDSAVRHVQVLRLQPGDEIWLLDGEGLGWSAEVLDMGRKAATVRLLAPLVRDVELPVRVSLLVGVPANDRMDALVEKATELGAWSIRPVLCERSVWRADGARAEKKVAHWQGVAQAASEQSGRMVVPLVWPVGSLATSMDARTPTEANGGRAGVADRGMDAWFVLDPRASQSWGEVLQVMLSSLTAQEKGAHWAFVSGPEGGLSEAEVAACVAAGATPVRLGPRILRADTAPLAVLAALGASLER